MDWLEQELKRALARKEPGPQFAERLIAPPRRGLAAHRWIAAAASVAILAGGSWFYRWREGVHAKQQVLTAVRITAVKLNRVQVRVKEVSQ